MTETSTTVVMSMPEDSFEVVLSTLGRVVDHVEVPSLSSSYYVVELSVKFTLILFYIRSK